MLNFLRRLKQKSNSKQIAAEQRPPQPAAAQRLRLTSSGKSDFVLLISGAGIGDTGGGLCLFDGLAVKTIDRVTTAGLAVQGGRLARILSTPISTTLGEILVYDERGVKQYLRVDELSDAHYVIWDGENLVISSTGSNTIVWLNLAGEIIRRWRATGEDDSWHLNGVAMHERRLYACAFGRYQEYRGYKQRLSQGDGFLFEVESGHTVARGLCAPHNPLRVDGHWLICDSLRNSIVQFDANDGSRVRQAELRAFTRGLAVTDDYVIVGESIQRREAGKNLTGSFAVLRRSDLGLVARFAVPFREVSDIAMVPRQLAEAAGIGFRTNPLRVSETDQLQMFRDVGMEPARLWAVGERLNTSECRIRVEAALPAKFVAGKISLVDCTVTNKGEAFLCSELPYPVYISYKWRRSEKSPQLPHMEGLRTRLPKTLAPGESLRCRMEIQAPDIDGEAMLTVTMVQELVLWFDDADPRNGYSAVVRIEKKTQAAPAER